MAPRDSSSIRSKCHLQRPESRAIFIGVALVEDIAVEYITDLVHKVQDIRSKRGKLSVEDFLYLIRKDIHCCQCYTLILQDLPKLNRGTELLSMNEELKQARKVLSQMKRS
ncbi:transcription initiation factor TFIID subunit 13-like [Castanea sativa]|uniref:transcription initiation factor TFIID subunit 13-like n=1 Tax=Castanea sativa TaxID=21020 RepID=UPI003F64E842